VRAYDTETDREVALKLLPEDWAQNASFSIDFGERPTLRPG
jgi:hypothetical protein